MLRKNMMNVSLICTAKFINNVSGELLPIIFNIFKFFELG